MRAIASASVTLYLLVATFTTPSMGQISPHQPALPLSPNLRDADIRTGFSSYFLVHTAVRWEIHDYSIRNQTYSIQWKPSTGRILRRTEDNKKLYQMQGNLYIPRRYRIASYKTRRVEWYYRPEGIAVKRNGEFIIARIYKGREEKGDPRLRVRFRYETNDYVIEDPRTSKVYSSAWVNEAYYPHSAFEVKVANGVDAPLMMMFWVAFDGGFAWNERHL